MAVMALQGWFRVLNRVVRLLALALLLLIAAWLASNWNDAPAQPRPAALQLPSPTLPDDRNAYFALAGLRAEADRDPSTAGQALWKVLLTLFTWLAQHHIGWHPERNAQAIDAFWLHSLRQLDGGLPALIESRNRARLHAAPTQACWMCSPGRTPSARWRSRWVNRRTVATWRGMRTWNFIKKPPLCPCRPS